MAVQELYKIGLEKITCKLDHIRVKKEQHLNPTQEILTKARSAIVESHAGIQEGYRSMEDIRWSLVGPPTVEKIKEHKEWSNELEDRFIIFITKFSKLWKPKESWLCAYCDYQKICRNTPW